MMKQLIFASILGTAALAAYSAEVSRVAPNGATVTLSTEKGTCKEGKRAVWLSPDKKQTVNGCWTGQKPVITVQWADGDVSEIATHIFGDIVEQ